MDALFENAPLFVPGTPYAKVEDHNAAERELREGKLACLRQNFSGLWSCIDIGVFVPGDLTEKAAPGHDDEENKLTIEHINSIEKL